ncbi:MAG: PucR family transcriptional regulator ligand-binding domain-containing protein [Tetrasphaera sp.]
MPLTVEELCADESLGLRLVGGRSGRRNVIGWAHTSELVDPTDWLEGGELLMTLGLQLSEDPVEQRAYVERLAGTGLAGLAFDAGMIHPQIPAAITAAGDEFGLPVIAIPAPTPFLAISRAVISAVTADQVALVAQISRDQERLASAALLHGSGGVLATLQRALTATAVTIDSGGELVESAGPGAAALARRVGDQLAQRAKRRQRSFSHGDDDGYFIVQALSKSTGAGYLAVGGRDRLSSNQRLLVSHAVTLLSILLDRPAHLHEAEMRLRRLLFRSLLRPGADVDQGLLRYVGFAEGQPVAVVAFVDAGPPRGAEAAVDEAVNALGVPALVLANAKGLAILTAARAAREVAEAAQGALAPRRRTRPSAGIGSAGDLSAVVDGYRQAFAAARYAAAEPGQILGFEELGIFDLLLGTQPRDTLAAIAGSVLRPLDAAAHGHPGELLRTVNEFVAQGGHWEATSASLGVHRHTLRNRIERISGLLGRDLTQASERAEVWLALRARELLSLTSSSPGDESPGVGRAR